MDEDIISVIVPVHNVEAYLEYSLNSILSQTYKNLEIILVENGSSDFSAEICDKYAMIDNRIHVIHEPVGDLSLARNIGIENATGKYISFIDSDDYIHPDYFQRLYELISKNDVDIVVCGYCAINLSEKDNFLKILDSKRKDTNKNIEIYDNQRAVMLIYDSNVKTSVNNIITWNKLYKKKLWDKIRFPLGRLHEDDHTTYKVLYNAKNVLETSEVLYGYIKRSTSIMGKTFTEKRIEDTLSAYNDAAEFFYLHNDSNLEGMARRKYLEYCIELSNKINDSNLLKKIELQESLKKNFIESYEKYIELIKNSRSDEKQKMIISIIEKVYSNIVLENVPLYTFWSQLSLIYK